jgi:phage terminase Nu1 subunit (DNA packaging protein)
MFTAALPGNVLLLGAEPIENTVSPLLLRLVYRAVAQQRVDQIRYNIIKYI